MMKAKLTDRELLLRLKDGDRKAFNVIYDQWSGHVYNFTCKTLFNKSLAEDITQELFLKLWEFRTRIDEERNFQAWIFTVARNLIYREGRRMLLNSAYIEVIHKSVRETEEGATDEMVNYDLAKEQIEELVERLPPARKRIYILNKQEGLTIREIALRLNLSEKTVETQLYHANIFMRTHFRRLYLPAEDNVCEILKN